MKPLGLKFRIDDLGHEGTPFVGELPESMMAEMLPGLVGTLGYRPDGPARVEGTAYRSAGGEIIVDGRVRAQVGFDCVRCLNARTLAVDLRADHVFVKRAKPATRGDETVTVDAAEADDDDVETYHGDEIDLTDTFREDLLLELPMNPSCEDVHADGCESPALRSAGPVDTVDPRWAPLAELKKRLDATREPDES